MMSTARPPLTWSQSELPIGSLVPNPDNPRYISRDEAMHLMKGWDEMGQFQTLAVGPAGEVYDGHQRLASLLAIHGPDYRVMVLQASRPLTDEERKIITVLAHVVGGQWDENILAGWDAGPLAEWGLNEDALARMRADLGTLGMMVEAEGLLGDYDEQDGEGDGDESDFWPVVRIRLDPESYNTYQATVANMPGEDEAARFMALVHRVRVAE